MKADQVAIKSKKIALLTNITVFYGPFLTYKRLVEVLEVIASVDLKECPRIALMKPIGWLFICP
jgi:hypothetical protein